LVIDLSGCGFAGITTSTSTVSVGGLATMAAVAQHPDVRREVPALADAVDHAASPAVRQMGTIAGNLLQRTRCPYFRSAGPCNRRDPGSGCSADGGDQRAAAILGASPGCVATHPSDLAVVLTVLEAELVVQGEAGRRSLAVEALYPAMADPAVEHTLIRGELITEIRVPLGRASRQARFVKIRDRASFDFALVAAAGFLIVEDGIIAEARLAFGGVAARPWRARRAEAQLIGRRPAPEAVALAVDAELAGAIVLPGARFKPGLMVRAATKVLL
jgi:xanthine dehydrogenase YagS FAD-binding subunit